MKMKFDVPMAIDNAIEVIKNPEDFYRTYMGEQVAWIKIEDSFFITVDGGFVKQEFKREGFDPRFFPDHKFVSDICDIRHCHLSEDEIREKIRLFLYNIEPTGS